MTAPATTSPRRLSYAGIGARRTPPGVLADMTRIARWLQRAHGRRHGRAARAACTWRTSRSTKAKSPRSPSTSRLPSRATVSSGTPMAMCGPARGRTSWVPMKASDWRRVKPKSRERSRSVPTTKRRAKSVSRSEFRTETWTTRWNTWAASTSGMDRIRLPRVLRRGWHRPDGRRRRPDRRRRYRSPTPGSRRARARCWPSR